MKKQPESERAARLLVRREARRVSIATCTGHVVGIISDERTFMGPVSQPENPAAHGNITVTEHCHCGATRNVNINQHHYEYGVWSVGSDRSVT